ncbi:MAG: DNA gyrase inhibitor YacG [Nevskiales bacterium]|nr:DNA gyrase inhibitor YacG [Nevskiales bacterium]
MAADDGNPWRPFCSERCKLADLGRWFSGRYTIPADGSAEHEEHPAAPPGKPADRKNQDQ